MTLTKLAIASALAVVAMSAQAITYEPGTYTVKVQGHNATFDVAVTLSRDKIENIAFPDEQETNGIGKVALAKLSKEILENQSIGVDNITGATISSFALKTAVEQALKNAKVSAEDLEKLLANTQRYVELPPEIDTQVVVVGGGGAGLSAAISAQQSGAKVIVIEKLGFLGGTTNISVGNFNAVDPEKQEKQGIKDSEDQYYNDIMKGGHDKSKPELARYLSKHGLETLLWIEGLGVEFKDVLHHRTHNLKKPGAYQYTEKYEKYIDDHKDEITVYTDMTAIELIRNDSGRIIGVTAKDNHTGKLTNFMAERGVVLATGGFSGNVKMRQEENTGALKDKDLGPMVGTTNIAKGSQGEGVQMARKVGANTVDMSEIEVLPRGTPKTGHMTGIDTGGHNRIFVTTEGKRFINENGPGTKLTDALFQIPGTKYYVLVNNLRYPSADTPDENGRKMKDMVEMGQAVEAGTLDELAKKLGVPVENLKASVDSYNSIVKGDKKDEFGFTPNPKLDKLLTEGPWFASAKVPSIHHTMGGIDINDKTQVLDKDGNVIPGLYAAGETTGGVHGDTRMHGNGITDAMVFGRNAGIHAATGK